MGIRGKFETSIAANRQVRFFTRNKKNNCKKLLCSILKFGTLGLTSELLKEFLKELLKILVCCTLLGVTLKLTDIIWKL